jgi:hypothetical protein
MRKLAFVLAASILSTTAFAQDMTTTRTIEQKRVPRTISSTTVTTGSGVGCTTETKQKTDEFGGTTTKKTTEC